MTVFKKIKSKLVKGAQNNLSLAIYSLIIAILLWFVISMTFYPSVPKTIENVELSLDLSGTSASDMGLTVIDCDVETVKVRIKGSRTQVGNLNSDSLTAYIDANNVTTTGKKTLSIKVRGNSNINYEVDSITPSTATVFIDKYETREFKVKPKIQNIKLSGNDKIIDNDAVTCEPDVVNITGPSAQLDKIDTENGCFAVSEKEETLNASYTVQSDKIELYGEDGSIINQDKMTFDKTSFIIKVPVLTQKTVPLKVAIDAPNDFDTDWLMKRLKLSKESITLASGNAQTELPDTFDIGSIKLSDIGLDYSASFDISANINKYGLKNLSNFNTVTVELDKTDLDTKDFYINNINLLNKPSSDYEYSVITDTIKVTVIGPKETLAELTTNDFTANVDLLLSDATSSSDFNSSQFSADVTVSCSEHTRVWAISKSKIQILKTSKEASSETTDHQ